MPTLKAAIVPVTAFQQNCTILWDDDTKEAAVVDPGGDIDRIRKALDDLQLSVKAIWLTHGHIDHAAGAMDLKDALGVEIIGPHADDQPLLDGLEQQAQMFGMPGGVRNCTPDRYLEDGDEVTIGGLAFAVHHCPGHAPGHVVFHSPELKFAHVGDVLFNGSIGRTDLPGGNFDTLMRSIRETLMSWPDETQFICGHGPDSSIGQERATNPFLNQQR